MTQSNWFEPLAKITPFIFKIKTPNGSGTGFQISYYERTGFIGIATADHVISHADDWEQPIRIVHSQSGETLLINKKDRAIFRYPDKDLAFILFNKSNLPIESKPLQLIDKGRIIKQGAEVGWCGFPAVSINDLCFFAGYISCRIAREDSYLIDGVVINGVSGGPVFYIDFVTKEPKFCGVISAYIPNRSTGEAFPGLGVVRSVEPYQETLQNLKNLEDAKKKELEDTKKEEDKIDLSTENNLKNDKRKAKPKTSKRKKGKSA